MGLSVIAADAGIAAMQIRLLGESESQILKPNPCGSGFSIFNMVKKAGIWNSKLNGLKINKL